VAETGGWKLEASLGYIDPVSTTKNNYPPKKVCGQFLLKHCFYPSLFSGACGHGYKVSQIALCYYFKFLKPLREWVYCLKFLLYRMDFVAALGSWGCTAVIIPLFHRQDTCRQSHGESHGYIVAGIIVHTSMHIKCTCASSSPPKALSRSGGS
jgi:hypothetical protein